MKLIDIIHDEINEASEKYDLVNDKIMLFESTAYNNYIIKEKEAYLEAYRYGDNYDDEYVIESESKSFAEKTKNAIHKIIENLKEFLNTCKEKIIELFEKVRETSLVKKIQELIKINPNAANIKVDVEDNSKKMSILEKMSDSAKKQLARIRSGKYSEHDEDELDERDNKLSALEIGGIAFVTVTLGALLVMLNKSKTDTTKRTTFDQNAYTINLNKALGNTGIGGPLDASYDSLNGMDDKAFKRKHDPNAHQLLTKSLSQAAKIDQKIAKEEVTRVSSIINGMKAGIGTVGNTAVKSAHSASGKHVVPTPSVDDVFDKSGADLMKSYPPQKTPESMRRKAAAIKTNKEFKRAGANLIDQYGATESAEEYDEYYDDNYYDENYDNSDNSFNADEYFSELCNDIFGDDTSTEDDFDTMYSELCNDIFF